MQVQASEVKPCELQVSYVADDDVVKSKRIEAVQQLRGAKVAGFRQGKVPDDVLKHHFKKEIDAWVLSEMLSVAYDDVIFETGIKPVGFPKVSSTSLDGNKYSCELYFLKKPDFELADYKSFDIPPNSFPSFDEECEALLQNVLSRHASVVPFSDDDVAAAGDTLTISYKKNGESFDGILYDVNGQEFDQFVIGMKSGETRQFNIGDDQYELEVHMGVKKSLPELTDELVKELGFENSETFRQQLVAVATLTLEQKKTNYARNFILHQLIDRHPFAVPEVLANMETQALASREGKKVEEMAEDEVVKLFDRASQQVKLSFILDSIREQEVDATLSDAEARQSLIARIAQGGNDPNIFLKNAQMSGALIGMLSALKDEYTVQWLIKQSGFFQEQN